MKKNLVALFLIFSTIGHTSAQIIKGIVKDVENNEEITGAAVYLKSNITKGTTSGFDGSFVLNGLSLPETIIISFLGLL